MLIVPSGHWQNDNSIFWKMTVQEISNKLLIALNSIMFKIYTNKILFNYLKINTIKVIKGRCNYLIVEGSILLIVLYEKFQRKTQYSNFSF